MKYPQSLSMPSAVSDWLEEQLEARGIDAVLYTRYILSLLHTHTLDVIYPEDDLQFSRLRKEVRRSSGCSKRYRRWRHAQADAEQLKRSAAVECLMSASDQNCEIESLVDELCEKLKEINSDTSNDNQTIVNTVTPSTKKNKISPQELAEKYYTAFPPLCPNESNNSATNFLTNFIPQWIAASGSPKKNKKERKNRREVMKSRGSQNIRQRLFYNHNTSNNKRDSNNLSSPPTSILNFATNKDLFESYDMNNWAFFNNIIDDDLAPTTNSRLGNKIAQQQDQIVQQELNPMENEEENAMYEDLPLDISDLLSDSPCTLNSANVKDDNTSKKYNFIQCGTNIISSIWTNDDEKRASSCLNNETIVNLDESWPSSFASQNTSIFETFHNNDQLFDVLTMSLMKINHNKEKSSFAEVMPNNSNVKTSNDSQLMSRSSCVGLFQDTSSLFRMNKNVGSEKEDLLTSEKSHFKPIDEKTLPKEYENGATFVISNNIDKVDYKRSESGTMYLENEFGQNKKYGEYKTKEMFLKKRKKKKETPSEEDFVLKFRVCQNDKACQTDTEDESDFNLINSIVPKFDCEGKSADVDLDFDLENEKLCDSPLPPRSESIICEITTWKYDPQYCDKCNNNEDVWKKANIGYDVWKNNDYLKNIWDGKEVCHTCLRLNGGAVTPLNTLLREDISQDGEQLLSDLSSLQKTYMESLPPLFAYPKRIHTDSFTMETDVTNSADVNGLWSFASRLEEDCLGTITSLPTLRSVTL